MPLKLNIKTLAVTFVAPLMLASVSLFSAPALAASTDALVDMCIQAMDDQSIAKAEESRTKLKKIRGGGLKRLTLEVMPLSGDGANKTIECHVRSNKVVALIAK